MAATWASSVHPIGVPCSSKKSSTYISYPNHASHAPNPRIRVVEPPAHAQYKKSLIEQAQFLISGDETSEMLSEKKRFDAAIEQYLCSMPHSVKFCHEVTSELFQDGILSPDFNPILFVAAWEHLSRYAMNLLSRPWRLEYRLLKLYSGFYKHFVEPGLPEAFHIFDLMGYSRCSGENQSVMKLLGPIDPDALLHVYLDCTIAARECDMMSRIKARTKDIQASWADCLSVRERFVCDVDKACDILHKESYSRQNRRLSAEHSVTTVYVPGSGGTVFRNPGFNFDYVPEVPAHTKLLNAAEPRRHHVASPENSAEVIHSFKSLKLTDRIKGKDLSVVDGSRKSGDAKKWSCHTCTFLNSPDAQICAMCSKSCQKGAEEKPLIVGGKECLSCTYVNERNVDTCTMCQDSLLNCPTYT